jgi:hypothetical protein
MRQNPSLRILTLAASVAVLAGPAYFPGIDSPPIALTDSDLASNVGSREESEARTSFVRGAISGVVARDSGVSTEVRSGAGWQCTLALDQEYKDLVAAVLKGAQGKREERPVWRAIWEALTESHPDLWSETSQFDWESGEFSMELDLRAVRARRAAMQRRQNTDVDKVTEIWRELEAALLAQNEPAAAVNSPASSLDTFLVPISVNTGGDDGGAGIGAGYSTPAWMTSGTSPGSGPVANAPQSADWYGIAPARTPVSESTGGGSWAATAPQTPLPPPLWNRFAFSQRTGSGNAGASGRNFQSFSHISTPTAPSENGGTLVISSLSRGASAASMQSRGTPATSITGGGTLTIGSGSNGVAKTSALISQAPVVSGGPSPSTLALLPTVAATSMFTYTGAIQQYTVQTTGNYAFGVNGAQGGSGTNTTGGGGTDLTGLYALTFGTVLDIVVGGVGEAQMSNGNSAGGGGGGTFVYIANATNPLIVAGGGGGGGFHSGNGGNNGTGTAGSGTKGGTGGGGGGAGSGSFGVGGGGAGWSGAGGSINDSLSGQGGSTNPSFAGGSGYQGGDGGYGGGGGGGAEGGGGGGGYSGGGGGPGSTGPGGGGGSFFDASFTSTTAVANANTGNGLVTIVLVPEPASVVLMAGGFALVGLFVRRRPRLS